MQTIAKLLDTYSVETFFQKNWGKLGVKITASDRQRFQHLFSWEKLTELLNFHEKEYPTFRLAYDKEVLNPSDNNKLVQHCRKGATLIIDRVHQKIPAIAELVSGIQYDFGLGHKAQVNTYCSWPGVQGFDCHYDTHEVFILQVEGNKEWFVFDDTIGHPLESRHFNEALPPEIDPYIQTTLEPGDILYIPRGHWHYALANDQPSIHLTLGINCHTGVDFLEWLTNELKQEQELRQNLPTSITSLNSDILINYVDNLTTRLKQHIANNNLGQKYADYLASRQNIPSNYSFPEQVGVGLKQINYETVLRWPRYQRAFVNFISEENKYQLRVGSKEIKLKGIPESFINNLLAYQQFQAQQADEWLAGYDWELDTKPLLNQLVMEGVLFIDKSKNIFQQELN